MLHHADIEAGHFADSSGRVAQGPAYTDRLLHWPKFQSAIVSTLLPPPLGCA
jgi:hypothetical protein